MEKQEQTNLDDAIDNLTLPISIQTDWASAQKRTFTNWVNAKLSLNKDFQISDLSSDFCDGRKLLALLSVLSSSNSGDKGQLFDLNPERQCSLRIHKISNVGKALRYIESASGELLINIGAEEIVDGNLKLTLGLVWQLILRFHLTKLEVTNNNNTIEEEKLISPILNSNTTTNIIVSEDLEEIDQSKLVNNLSSIKKKIKGNNKSVASTLQKAQRSTLSYVFNKITEKEDYLLIMEPEGPPKSLGKAWSDGKAFCCLVNSQAPEYLSLKEIQNPVLCKEDARKNLDLAFRIASENLKIPALLNSNDVIEFPDDKSILTYLAFFLEADKKLKQDSEQTRIISPCKNEVNNNNNKEELEKVARASSLLEDKKIIILKSEFNEKNTELQCKEEISKKEIDENITKKPKFNEINTELRHRISIDTQTSREFFLDDKDLKKNDHEIYEIRKLTKLLLKDASGINIRTMKLITVQDLIENLRERLVKLNLKLTEITLNSPPPPPSNEKNNNEENQNIREAFSDTSENLFAVRAIIDSQAYAVLTNKCISKLWIFFAIAAILFAIRKITLWSTNNNNVSQVNVLNSSPTAK